MSYKKCEHGKRKEYCKDCGGSALCIHYKRKARCKECAFKIGYTITVNKHQNCIFEDCKKRPIFNKKGEKKGLYCNSHKLNGMIDIINKTCIFEDCKIRPNFNKEGEKRGLYCLNHKLDNMVDVLCKNCIFEGCKKVPTFNKEGFCKALYCNSHKLNDMVDIRHKTCIFKGCKIRPNFNKESEKIGLYCSEHKLENMINVTDKTCIFENCKTQPIFNKEGEKRGLYCKCHKLNGMVNVIDKTCIFEGCRLKPSFNNDDKNIGLYCSTHKLDGMVDVTHIKCKTYLCSIQPHNKKYDGYCVFCYIHLFPDKPVSKNYKTKETETVCHIKEAFPDFTWVADKKINGGCSNRRPDLLLDLGSHIIIVEIDENRHTNYDCSCEHKRLMEISQDLNFRPIVFIRFNPDAYIKNEKTISSCWSQNGNGIMSIKKSKQKEWKERITVLKEKINYYIDNLTEKTIEIIELFY